MDTETVVYYIDWIEDYLAIPTTVYKNMLAKETGGGNIYAINPYAYNPRSGAAGLAQFTPITLREIQRLWGVSIDPYEPIHAVVFGALYLRYLYNRFRDWRLAVAAYNWGPGSVRAWLAGLKTLPRETANYIAFALKDTAYV